MVCFWDGETKQCASLWSARRCAPSLASCGSVTYAFAYLCRGSVRWAFAPSSPPAAYRRGGCGCAWQPPARCLLQNRTGRFAPKRHAAIAALPAYRRVGTAVAPKGASFCLSSPTHHPNLIPLIYHHHFHDPAPANAVAGFWCLRGGSGACARPRALRFRVCALGARCPVPPVGGFVAVFACFLSTNSPFLSTNSPFLSTNSLGFPCIYQIFFVTLQYINKAFSYG